MVVPPSWQPSEFNDERTRQQRVEKNIRRDTRRSWMLVIAGVVLILGLIPAILFDLPGLGIILVPLGMFMIIGGAIQLIFERGD